MWLHKRRKRAKQGIVWEEKKYYRCQGEGQAAEEGRELSPIDNGKTDRHPINQHREDRDDSKQRIHHFKKADRKTLVIQKEQRFMGETFHISTGVRRKEQKQKKITRDQNHISSIQGERKKEEGLKKERIKKTLEELA